MKRSEILFGLLKIPVDFMAVVLASLAAYELRLLTEPIPFISKEIDYTQIPPLNEYLYFSFETAIALILVFTVARLYRLKSTSTFSRELKKVFWSILIWAMLIISYYFFAREFPFSRLAIVYSWIATVLFVTLGRALIKTIQRIFLRAGIGKRRILILGENNISKELIQTFEKDPNYKIIDIVNPQDLDKIVKISKEHHIEEIIQTTSNESTAKEILSFCEEYHIEYTFVPDTLQVQRTNVDIKMIRGIPLITLKKTPLDGWGKITKRIADILVGTIVLIALSPIFLITAIAIRLDSKGKVFYSAKRIGTKGKPFTCHKFRSMLPNTHELRYSEELLKNNKRDGSPLVKIVNDPRVTRVGKFIRKFSIDELPQLWNVIKGDMSLVGPRPHLPEEVEKYARHHKFVLTIKPGITGLPQTSGRSDLDFEQEVKLDRYYIEHWSLILDIKTIFKTIWIVAKGYRE